MNCENIMVSIIVPVYRKEDTLKRCINSILNSRHKNIEVILIDDGSPDGCGMICDEFNNIDERVTVVHKKNEGVSAARNIGICQASGKYISFVDADDEIKENFLSRLLSCMDENTDIVVGANRDKGSTFQRTLDRETALYLMFDDDNFGVNVWGKLYRLDIIRDLTFPVGITMGEDMSFMFHAIMKSDRIRYISDANYVQRTSRYNSSTLSSYEAYMSALEIAVKCKDEAIVAGFYKCDFVISKAIVLRALWALNIMIAEDRKKLELFERCRTLILDNRYVMRSLSFKHRVMMETIIISVALYKKLIVFFVRRKCHGKRNAKI